MNTKISSSKVDTDEVGYMKVSVEGITKTEAYPASTGMFEVTLGGTTEDPVSVVFNQDNSAEIATFFTYAASPLDQASFKLTGEKGVTCFSKFPILKLCQIPQVRHSLEVELIHQQKFEESKQIEVMAVVKVEMLYLNGKVGVLECLMIQAKLERDTEIMGQMDPYIRMEIDGHEFKTGVKDNEGKHPVWNAKFKIPVNTVKSKLKVQVFDKDLMSDDLVGSRQIHLLEQKFLRPSKSLVTRQVIIYYDGKPSGSINLQSRFILSQC